MRCFVAIDLPGEQREATTALCRGLRSAGAHVSWVRPENLHLTLCFLGEVSREQADTFGASFGDAVKDVPPFDLTPKGLGCFPNLKRPAVVWVGLEGGETELTVLHRACCDAAGAARISLDDKPFRPHITIGRIRDRRQLGTLPDALGGREAFSLLPYTVAQIRLYESVLGIGPPRYHVRSRWALETPAAS